MNLLQRALIEKVGYEQGFEHVLPSENDVVHLSSARHWAETTLTIQVSYYALGVYSDATKRLSVELREVSCDSACR